MHRMAILVGANRATSSPLQGVDADIRRLRNHLRSNFGGKADRILSART
jgi:hypothetical protein